MPDMFGAHDWARIKQLLQRVRHKSANRILLVSSKFFFPMQLTAPLTIKHVAVARRLPRFGRVEFSGGQGYAPLLLHFVSSNAVSCGSGWTSR